MVTAERLGTSAFWLRWFRDPYGDSSLALGVFVLAAAGVAARPRAAGRLALVFLPILGATLALHSDFAAPRYAAILLPFPSALAALGVEAAAGAACALPAGRVAAALLGAALVAAEAKTGLRAVLLVSSSPSPPAVVMARVASDPALSGRSLVVDERLFAHASALLCGRRTLLLPEGKAAAAAPGELVLACDRELPGAAPLVVARLDDPLLSRLTLGRFLSAAVYDGGLRPAGDSAVGLPRCQHGPARIDLSLPVSVDSPSRGAAVLGALVSRGWARERGGGRVDPVNFLLDGRPITPDSIRRIHRPDVAAAIPEVGSPEGIGWEATFRPPSPGEETRREHSLVVVFQTPDGRVRAYDPVRFSWDSTGQP
jgi:hypothetical protein